MKLAHHSMTWGGWMQRSGEKISTEEMLAQIAEIGYVGVEMGGTAETHGPADELLKKVEAAGLEIAAWCSFISALPSEDNLKSFKAAVDYAADLGQTVMMVCGGWLPEPRRNTFDSDYQLFADSLRPAVEYAASKGQKLAFHPHMDCIVETDGEIRQLLQHLPELDFCIDCGHLAGVRVDAAAATRELGSKVVHTHVKDYSFANRKFAELGHGDAEIDFTDFFNALKETGFDGWLVVERDDPPMHAAESARLSYEFIAPVAAPFLS
jgi:inosose dehydratase